jgi:hypothetical protein
MVFNRVCRLEMQSVMLVFSTSIECVREGEYGVIGRGGTDKTPAAKSLYRPIFLDNDIWHCFLPV